MSEILKAKLRYAGIAPSEDQISKIKGILLKKFEVSEIDLELVQDTSIGGGFIV